MRRTSARSIAARWTASRADSPESEPTISLARWTVSRSTGKTSSTNGSSASNAGWTASWRLIAW